MTTANAIVLAAYVLGLVISVTSAVGMLFAARSMKLAYVGAIVLAALSLFLLVQLLTVQRAVLGLQPASSSHS